VLYNERSLELTSTSTDPENLKASTHEVFLILEQRKSMPQTFGPYSPVRKAGNHYYFSGQVGVDSDKHASLQVQDQAQQAMQNLQAVLESVNLTADDIIKTTIFLKRMADFDLVTEVYLSFFSDPRPARSCVAVADLPHIADNELLVEIEAVAYKDEAA
jgi:2-iminobutanoate/2-iminopropanoate deaminase